MTDKEQQRKEYLKAYYQAKKDKIKEQAKIYALENKDKIKQYQKEYRKRDENYRKEPKVVIKQNKDKVNKVINKQPKKRIIIYDDIEKQKRKEYYLKNKDKIKGKYNLKKQKIKDYYENNKTKIIERQNAYIKNKRQTNPLFRLSSNISRNIRHSLTNKGFNKLSSTYIILGCSLEEFKEHLENQFEPWMNWDNYGNPKDGIYELNKTWDIDHIIPTSIATTELELIGLNHYTNLQPLCSYHNRFIKSNKII